MKSSTLFLYAVFLILLSMPFVAAQAPGFGPFEAALLESFYTFGIIIIFLFFIATVMAGICKHYGMEPYFVYIAIILIGLAIILRLLMQYGIWIPESAFIWLTAVIVLAVLFLMFQLVAIFTLRFLFGHEEVARYAELRSRGMPALAQEGYKEGRLLTQERAELARFLGVVATHPSLARFLGIRSPKILGTLKGLNTFLREIKEDSTLEEYITALDKSAKNAGEEIYRSKKEWEMVKELSGKLEKIKNDIIKADFVKLAKIKKELFDEIEELKAEIGGKVFSGRFFKTETERKNAIIAIEELEKLYKGLMKIEEEWGRKKGITDEAIRKHLEGEGVNEERIKSILEKVDKSSEFVKKRLEQKKLV